MTRTNLSDSIEQALCVLDEQPLAIPAVLAPFVDELSAIGERRLVPVNVDVARAALVVVGVSSAERLRAAMVE